MIQAKNITKRYGDLEVLRGIDLEIPDKSIVSIVGRSGAGKTTLLQILGTLLSADTGQVIIQDIDTAQLKEKSLARFRNTNIGFVFQFHQLLPEFTAIENVCIPGYIAKRTQKEVETRAVELLRFLNLEHRLNHKPSELSGGEQQRVAVARALINNPSVIFADEPSGNLDSKNKQELHDLFFTLRDSFEKTFVIVTHDESLADRSDLVLRMADGRII